MSGRVLTAAAGLALAVALSGCDGSTSTAHRRLAHGPLAVIAGLPLTGPTAPAGQATLQGARMALAAVHGRVGRYPVTLRALNDATVASRGWDPGQTTLNARVAAKDPRVVGYLGDLNSGATAVSLPVLNRAAIPQISPLSTAVGLTRAGPEASPGEPQKYYPTAMRTFARVVPSDVVQSAVQVALQRRAGCRRGYVVNDDEVDGRDAATSFQAAARRAGLNLLGFYQYDPTARAYVGLEHKLAKLQPDCVLIGAVPQDNAVAVTTAIARTLPTASLFATASLADPAFVGHLPATVAARLTLTYPALDPRQYPPAGRRVLAAAARRLGPASPDAIFGYAAMALMLDAISRASHGGTRDVERPAVVRAILHSRERHSVLGPYGITAGGDTTLRRFGVYRVVGGRLVFDEALRG